MFNGFLPPTENWSKLPHQFIEALPQVETIAEMKIILYILRHTWGYHDNEKKITIDEFCNGRKKRDGSRIDNGTGLSPNAIRDGINRAIEHGFICVGVDDSDKARIKKYYKLTEPESSGVQSLNPRPSNSEPHSSNSEPRTEKETKEKLKKDNMSPFENLCQYFSGYTDKWPKGLIDQQEWDDDCMEILNKAGGDENLAKNLITQAINTLNELEYQYKTPASLLDTIDIILKKRDKENSNGRNGNQPNIVLPATANSDGSYNF